MNRILQLLDENKGRGSFIVENKTSAEANIYLHDIIVSDSFLGGISAKDFALALSNISTPLINLRINCPGGDVFAARAMVQAMREHPSEIHAYIDGIAASAATFLVVASDKSYISEGASLMIHRAHTLTAGDARDLLKMSELLQQVDKTIIDDYARKTGKPAEKIASLMDATTYFFGKEAVDAGFVDAFSEVSTKNTLAWNLAAYTKSPDQQADKVDLSMHHRRLQLAIAMAI